jgi:ribosomal protein S18 acetylase RimI-like enzyme
MRKRSQGDDLILVASRGDRVVGAVALGWDGVRGWIYHLAVAPGDRRHGVGTALMRAAEQRLHARGSGKTASHSACTAAASASVIEPMWRSPVIANK